MIDPGAVQNLIKQLNRWHRKRARPHGAIDHFHRGTRMTYTATYRGVIWVLAALLLAFAVVLYFAPGILEGKSPWVVLLMKLGWYLLVALPVFLLFRAYREYVVVTDDALVKFDVFGRETRMAWRDISTYRINCDANKVIFPVAARGKFIVSLSYDGWTDFLEIAARRMNPALYWQFRYGLTKPEPVSPLARFDKKLTWPKWLSFGRSSSKHLKSVAGIIILVMGTCAVPAQISISNLLKVPLVITNYPVLTNYPAMGFVPTNSPSAAVTFTNSESSVSSEIIPLIDLQDVPITTVIENLARQARINFMFDWRLSRMFTETAEPIVNIRLKKTTARDALEQVLDRHDLILIDNPATQIASILTKTMPKNIVDATLLGLGSTAPSSTNGLIPLIQFSEVPLDFALVNLIQESGLKIELNPRLLDSADAREFSRKHDAPPIQSKVDSAGGSREKWFKAGPLLSVRWENITSTQALAAVCANYGLTITKDDATGVVQIKPKETKKHHHLQLK